MGPRSFSRFFLGALAILTLPGTALGAQQADESNLARAIDSFDFREIGPAIMGGRVSDIDVDPNNSAHWFVGFGTGGVWETRNEGMSWTPLFDDEATSSIGDVTLAPSNPNVIWVGTGEPQNRNSSPYGSGVYRSVDGGRNWTHVGLEGTQTIGKIAVHPRDPDVAYVAAVGHLWGPNDERGVYRTTDGGENWERVLYIDDDTGAIDIVMDPNDPKTLFASMYQRRRTAYSFSAWGPGSGLYRTVDGGDNWSELTEGLPEGDKGRIGIDVFKKDGNLIYATVEGANRDAAGLYRSTDRGETWEKVSENNPRPMYFSMVRIDPNNPDRIYMGGVVLQVSDDGGRSWWPNQGYWEIHVDNHALWIDPNNSNHVIVGEDGGIASSWDAAQSWRHHNNLAVGQFYEIGVDMRDPYYVCGGLQDNSSWCGPSNSLDVYGIDNGKWYDVSGGDGFYNQIDPNDWRYVYTESQGGNLSRKNVETGEAQRIRPTYRGEGQDEGDDEDAGDDEDGEGGYSFNWNSPVVVSQHDSRTVYIGNDHLMRSRDQGQSWEEASPDLTRMIDRDTLEIFGRPLSESHLSKHDGMSDYGAIVTVDESPISADVLWAGTDDGNLQVTRDGGATWTNVVGNVPGLPGRRFVSRVEASAHELGRAYVTFDGHHDDDLTPYLFVTENFGESWQRISNGLPNHSLNVVREHPNTARLLFVGNEVGVFASVDRGQNWYAMKGDLPRVPVDDLVIHPRENDLVVGTHGRSIWIADDIGPLEQLTEELADRPFHMFLPSDGTMWSRTGNWPFWGDIFFGENPADGVRIRYHLAEEMDAESVELVINNDAGNPVRTLHGPTEAGMHVIYWDFNEDAPYEPEPEPGPPGQGRGFGGAPAGPQVLPGAYRVAASAAGMDVMAGFTVRLDPRVETTEAALQERYDVMRDAHLLAVPARDAAQALRRLTEQLGEVSELLDDMDDAPEDLTDQVDSLQARVRALNSDMGPVNGASRAGGAVRGDWGAPTADTHWAIDQGWDAIPGITRRINVLIQTDLPTLYRQMNERGIRRDPGEALAVPRRGGGD